jgi:hypothetical protein
LRRQIQVRDEKVVIEDDERRCQAFENVFGIGCFALRGAAGLGRRAPC